MASFGCLPLLNPFPGWGHGGSASWPLWTDRGRGGGPQGQRQRDKPSRCHHVLRGKIHLPQ